VSYSALQVTLSTGTRSEVHGHLLWTPGNTVPTTPFHYGTFQGVHVLYTVYLNDTVPNRERPFLFSRAPGDDLGQKDTVITQHMLVATPTSNAETKACR